MVGGIFGVGSGYTIVSIMKKFFYIIINPCRKLYWFVFRPHTTGVKCLIEYNNKFLLIRNSYGIKHWTFPGGSVEKGELPSTAAQREAREEVGIELTPQLIGQYSSNREFKQDTVHCFYGKVTSDYFKIDNDEIMEAAWFLETNIPPTPVSSAAVTKVLNLYKSFTLIP